MPFRKNENRSSASKPPNCSLYLKAAELILPSQSHRIPLVCLLPQNDIARSSSKTLNLLRPFSLNILHHGIHLHTAGWFYSYHILFMLVITDSLSLLYGTSVDLYHTHSCLSIIEHVCWYHLPFEISYASVFFFSRLLMFYSNFVISNPISFPRGSP